MKIFNVIMFKFSYRMLLHYSKEFDKWNGIFRKYCERLKQSWKN